MPARRRRYAKKRAPRRRSRVARRVRRRNYRKRTRIWYPRVGKDIFGKACVYDLKFITQIPMTAGAVVGQYTYDNFRLNAPRDPWAAAGGGAPIWFGNLMNRFMNYIVLAVNIKLEYFAPRGALNTDPLACPFVMVRDPGSVTPLPLGALELRMNKIPGKRIGRFVKPGPDSNRLSSTINSVWTYKDLNPGVSIQSMLSDSKYWGNSGTDPIEERYLAVGHMPYIYNEIMVSASAQLTLTYKTYFFNPAPDT